MININMKDGEKWKHIREFHMEYSKKLINRKIEEVKNFESSKIKQVFSSLYTKKEKEINNINGNFNDDSCKDINIEVYELIQKIKIYNKSRREEISEILHGRIDENYILNILYDFDEQDLGKKPLSKLKYDVYNFFKDEVSKKEEAEIY